MTNKRLWIIVVLCFGALVAIKAINDRIGREVSVITETPRHGSATSITPAAPGAIGQKSSVRRRKPGEKIVRKDRLSPGRDYIESIFYLNEEEIARQKIVNDKVAESSDEITEGRVDFFDESKKTYGIEYYVEGKKAAPPGPILPMASQISRRTINGENCCGKENITMTVTSGWKSTMKTPGNNPMRKKEAPAGCITGTGP